MLITKTPNKVYIALSGGADSMFALHFLLQGRKDVTCLHFNHGTSESDEFEKFIRQQCYAYDVDLVVGKLGVAPPKGCSTEKHWRDERYKFFQQFTDAPIVTAHHLNDQIETRIMSLCTGSNRCINESMVLGETKFIRPFLRVDRDEILNYNQRHGVAFIEDKSNQDASYPRNRIRKNVIPELIKAYPGLINTLRKS